MNFASDNWAGAHPRIAAALLEHAAGASRPYQTGDIDKAVEQQFRDIFECDLAVFFVATGTAANALALAACARPGAIALAHEGAHLIADECGAAEYLGGGLRLKPVSGEAGRMDRDTLSHALEHVSGRSVHTGQAVAVSITQASEAGTVYSLDEIAAIGEISRRHGLALHMDGARFANAMVALNTSPAEMTWRRGVDLLSFGATKNGCWCAEALVVFDPARYADMQFIRKRAGQLFSKSRFVAAQFLAYFHDDLWLTNARHANAMAGRLAAVLEAASARFAWKSEANALFPIIADDVAAKMAATGASFHEWPAPPSVRPFMAGQERMHRLVTSFATQPSEVDAIARALAASGI